MLLLLGPAAASPVQQSKITVEDYCRLTQSLLELSVREWEERADLAATHKSERKQLTTKLAAVTNRYRPLREESYNRYGLSLAADLRYASEHQSEIETYLDENPEVRDALDTLKQRINALIEQFESAAPPPAEGALK
jgi:FMN phosphatase YigB (HAD superfamily)